MKNRIKKIIELSGLNTKEFSKSIGASAGNVGDWLAGRSEPSSKMLRRIYEKYQINLLWLLTGIGGIKKYPELAESFTGNISEDLAHLRQLKAEIEADLKEKSRLEAQITVLEQALAELDEEKRLRLIESFISIVRSAA